MTFTDIEIRNNERNTVDLDSKKITNIKSTVINKVDNPDDKTGDGEGNEICVRDGGDGTETDEKSDEDEKQHILMLQVKNKKKICHMPISLGEFILLLGQYHKNCRENEIRLLGGKHKRDIKECGFIGVKFLQNET